MTDIIEVYNNGTKVNSVPAFMISGRPVIEMSQSQYNAEASHVLGAIYIIWED